MITENNRYQVMQTIYKHLSNLIHNYLSIHSKALVIRADIRYPENYTLVNDNIHIQRCIAKTVQYFQRHGLDPAYMWVREQDSNRKHQHYHCFFLLNGQKTQSAMYLFNILERYWGNTIGHDATGLIDYCYQNAGGEYHENGKVITRNNGIPDYVFNQMSYLAKPKYKGERKDGLRDFGMSRLPSNIADNLQLF